MDTATTPPERKIYSVSELNRAVRVALETGFSLIWLEGEVSNLARPASGHLYFSLKDNAAQIRCALFRNRSRLLGVALENGQQVLVRARVGLYEPRGDYQLIVEHLEEAGEGALRRAFEQLKRKLDAEGLFATERKRQLPAFPRRVGVITSSSGAAVRDVLSVLRRRFPGLPVLVYPVQVQGQSAPAQIVAALNLASERRDCDVLLLVRGGGSLEDLQAFNDERVARAVVSSAVPVVAGVGHEVDFTIADLVADMRAPTPSVGAELVSPDGDEWLARVAHLRQLTMDAMDRRLRQQRQKLDWLLPLLARQHPGNRLQRRRERLGELATSLRQAMSLQLERRGHRLSSAGARLDAMAPGARLQQLAQKRLALERRIALAIAHRLQQVRSQLAGTSRALNDLSPLHTLARGYAVIRDSETGRVIRSTEDTRVDGRVTAQLVSGKLNCRVEGLES